MSSHACLRIVFLVASFACASAAGSSVAGWVADGNLVCAAPDWQGELQLVADMNGGVIIAWTDNRLDSTTDVYAQRLNSAGVPQWTTDGVAVCSAAFDQRRPLVLGDGNGGAVIVWLDDRNGTDIDIYAQRLNSDGIPQWEADGVPVCAQGGQQWFPSAIADGVGGVIVAWDDSRNESNDAICAQRLDGSGVAQWVAGGVVLCGSAGSQSLPTIASDGAGGAIAAWYDFRSGQADIYTQRVNNAGAVEWITDGVALCTAINSQSSPQTVPDGAGGAFITWTDHRGSTNDIYAQRVSAEGIPLWTADGVAVCTAASNQGQAFTIPDGAGGVIVTWVDPRDYALTRQDVYAQRLDSSGSPLWTTDGVAICTAAQAQLGLHVAGDGTGGAVIAWGDARDDLSGYTYDIYAQRVSASGTTAWMSNGVPICMAAGHQATPQLVNDGSGVVIAWSDGRGDVPDVYAQRLSLDGQFPTAVDRTPTIQTLSISPNVPNPFSASTYFDVYTGEASDGRLDIYDVTGRRVATRKLPGLQAGWQRVTFDGRDNNGVALPSGVYFCRVMAARQMRAQKIVIQR